MKGIGGFFELELNNHGNIFHDNAIALNSGRNALEYILLAKKYSKVYVPYYTCDVTLQPLKRHKIDYEFYYLNESFKPSIHELKNNEVLLFVNYFGVMNSIINEIRAKFANLVIDNSQAFYAYPIDNLPVFYSPRKFFGLPDGGFAYCDTALYQELDSDQSFHRISHLIKRIEKGAEESYTFFKKNDATLNNLPMMQMSKLTKSLLQNIDFKKTLNIRNDNFNTMHKALKSINELTPIIDKESISGPMVYPFLKKDNIKLKKHLIDNKIFVATYWPNVRKWFTAEGSFEYHLVDNLIPLPIDQRYDLNDMDKIINIILKKIKD
jgi:hypothetical protein